MKALKLYIPSLAKQRLDNYLKNQSIPVCDDFYDSILWVLDLITRLPTRIRDYEYQPDGFVSISSQEFFVKYLGPNYRFCHIQMLLDADVIQCNDGFCKVKGVPKGYKIHPELSSDFISYTIRKTEIRKKIIEEINKSKASLRYKPDYIRILEKNVTEMLIDFDSATEYVNNLMCIEQITPSQRDAYQMMINSIQDKNFHFSQCDTNHRLDTSLSNLASCLKQFINPHMDLVQTDLCNSQFTIFNLLIRYNQERDPALLDLFPKHLKTMIVNLLNQPGLKRGKFKIDPEERKKYFDWTTKGMFYENFVEEYNRNNIMESITREDLKQIMMQIVFSKNDNYVKKKEKFKSLFPTIYQFIEYMKSQDHTRLSICLQNIESFVFIENVAKLLCETGIYILTIHDSICVPKKDHNLVKPILDDVFQQIFGFIPKFKTENFKDMHKVKKGDETKSKVVKVTGTIIKIEFPENRSFGFIEHKVTIANIKEGIYSYPQKVFGKSKAIIELLALDPKPGEQFTFDVHVIKTKVIRSSKRKDNTYRDDYKIYNPKNFQRVKPRLGLNFLFDA